MLVARSGCSRTLIRMGNDENLMVVADVEEGEIPDSGNSSIEVEQKTTKADVGGEVDGGLVAGGRGGGGTNGNSRAWTMRDLRTHFPGYCGYVNSGLSNLAWAQAVQNKPFNGVLGMDYEPRESSESEKIVIDDSGDEKEEGELEEGEIDLVESASDENMAARVETETDSVVLLTSANKADDERIQKERDLEEKVKLIRGVLESTSLVEAQT